MMKTARWEFLLLSAAGAVLWLAGPPVLRAQRATVTLSEPAYRELRNLAERLDARARHAADRSAHERYRIYRRDDGFLRAVSDFAGRASRFNARMAEYRARPWPLDDDLDSLLRGALEIRDSVRTSRFADDHTLGDWRDVVEILNQMIRASQTGGGQIEVPPAGQTRDEYGERRDPPGRGDSRDLAGLARELEGRATSACEVAQRVAGEGPYRREYFQSIRDFRDRAAAFRRTIDSGASGRADIRAEAALLLESARRTDQRMRQGNGFREVWPDWQGAIQTLQRILDQAGNR